MHPKYSIIIPVYNVAPWLPACLDSVLRQTVEDWECICVDDGSVDESSSILDSYRMNDSRFVVCHQLNEGVSSARNFALDVARGDWLIFLDADDMLADDALQLFDRLEVVAPSADLMHFGISHIAESDRARRCGNDTGLLQVYRLTDRSLIVPGFSGIAFVTYAYRRQVMGDIRFKAYAIGEDRLYLAECHARCREKMGCSNIGYICRQRGGSALRSTWTLQKFSDSVRARREIIEVVDSLGIEIARHKRRIIYQSLLEMSAFDIYKVYPHDVVWAWKEYFDVIRTLESNRIPTCWQRLVVQVLWSTQSRSLGVLLCVVPHRLKLIKTSLKRSLPNLRRR